MTKQDGYVLPLVLILISFLAASISVYLEQSVLQYEISLNEYRYAQHWQTVQLALPKIAKDIEAGSSEDTYNGVSWKDNLLQVSACDQLNHSPVQYHEVLITLNEPPKIKMVMMLATPYLQNKVCEQKTHPLKQAIQSIIIQ